MDDPTNLKINSIDDALIDSSSLIRRLIDLSVYSIKHHYPREQWEYRVDTTRARWEAYFTEVYPRNFYQLLNYFDKGVLEILAGDYVA